MCETAVVLLLVSVLAPLPFSQCVTMVHEVNIGDTAVLRCPSNDDNHRFQFWHLLREDQMIGPTNKYNRNKYKYEVLTGALTIRGVSSNEHGLYTCVCKHLTDNSFNSETVELVVKKDWEEVYETDPFTNVIRISLMAAVLMVLVALVVVLYNMHTDRSPRFRALADEESPDEAGPSYKPVPTDDRTMSQLDSHGLDTELPRPSSSIFADIQLNETRL